MKIRHFEDLVLDPDTLLPELIHSFVEDLMCDKPKFTHKIDGICMVYGLAWTQVEDEYGDLEDDLRPFVSGKKFFNKKSIRYFSKEDILNSSEHEEMKKKLLVFFDHTMKYMYFSTAVGKEIYKTFEFMGFANEKICKPNIIEYHRDDPNIANPKFIPHTDYKIKANDIPYHTLKDIILGAEKITDIWCTNGCNKVLDPSIIKIINIRLRETDLSMKEILRDINRKSVSFGYSSNIFLAAYELKNLVMGCLPDYHYRTTYNGEDIPNEGYIWHSEKYGMVKLVHREIFSRINFRDDSSRGWKR